MEQLLDHNSGLTIEKTDSEDAGLVNGEADSEDSGLVNGEEVESCDPELMNAEVYSGDSGHDRTYNCQACALDGDTCPAFGWCETCDELLCDPCYKVHRRPTVTRHHQLWSLQEMWTRKQRKMVINSCKIHGEKSLTYFCESHVELTCSKCLMSKHNILCIDDVVTTDTEEFKSLETDLSNLTTRLRVNEETVVRNVTTSTRQREKTVAEVQEVGYRLKTLIHTLIEQQVSEAERVHEKNIKIMDVVEDKNKDLAENLEIGKTMLAGEKGDNNQLFLTMKHLQTESKHIESKLHENEKKNRIREYEFVLDSELVDVLEKVRRLGTFEDTHLDMDDVTYDVEGEVTVRRFTGGQVCSYATGEHAIQVSTDRDIRLLYVLLYSCLFGGTEVRLTLAEEGKRLLACKCFYPATKEVEVPVELSQEGCGIGVVLKAGHQYVITVKIKGGGYCGTGGRSRVTAGGVTFTFSNTGQGNKTTVHEGQIPGLRFCVL